MAPVTRVADSDSGVFVDEYRNGPRIVDVGTGECESTQLALVVDAGMQLEAVVFTLPVMTGVSDASSHPP